MRRILVMGPSGSGKSTLAVELGALLGIPVIHLDALHWRPGWVEAPHEELRAALLPSLQLPEWVIDGNYGGSGTLEARLAACDTVVYLDFPRRVCLYRVLRRWLRFRGRQRPDMGDDCPEKVDLEFLRWVWTAPARRPANLARLEKAPPTARVVVLESAADVRRFREGVAALGPVRSRATGPGAPARPTA
jgi:adenylate kinase family enzyme